MAKIEMQQAGKGLKYVEIAKANAGLTYGTQLTALSTTFNALTLEEKQLTRLYSSGGHFFEVQRAVLGIFNCCINAAGTWFILGADLLNHKYYTSQNFGSVRDASNDTNSSTMALYKLEYEE